MGTGPEQLISQVKAEFDQWLSRREGWHISQNDLAAIQRQIDALANAYWLHEQLAEAQRLRLLVRRRGFDESALFPSLARLLALKLRRPPIKVTP